MKKTLTLHSVELANNYKTNMLLHLVDCQHDEHPAEFAGEVIMVGTTLRNLLSKDNAVALATFRKEFGAGFTMMMFSDEEFNQVETWSKDREEFQVVIFREDGTPVGLIGGEFINW